MRRFTQLFNLSSKAAQKETEPHYRKKLPLTLLKPYFRTPFVDIELREFNTDKKLESISIVVQYPCLTTSVIYGTLLDLRKNFLTMYGVIGGPEPNFYGPLPNLTSLRSQDFVEPFQTYMLKVTKKPIEIPVTQERPQMTKKIVFQRKMRLSTRGIARRRGYKALPVIEEVDSDRSQERN